MSRRWIAILAGGFVLGLIVIGGLYLWLAGRHREAPTVAAVSRNPMAVAVSVAGEAASLPRNGSLPVSITYLSPHEIQVVQVWLDGKWLTDVVPAPGEDSVDVALPAALLSGDDSHTLVAVAVDADGRGSPGNAVRLRGLPPVEAEFILTTRGGESLSSIADRFGRPASSLLAGNGILVSMTGIESEADVLPAGLQVIVPLGEPSEPDASMPEAEPHPVSTAPGLPTPPSMALETEGCVVTARVQSASDLAQGYSLYRLDPDKSQFVRVGDLSASGAGQEAAFTDPEAFGQPLYYASAYNEQGETISPLALVDFADPACAQPSDLTVSDGILHLPQDLERVYLYAAINGGEFNRWPRVQGQFFIPDAGALDLHPLTDPLVDPAAGTGYPFLLDLEVWGWSAGELQYLGEVSTRMDGSKLAICNLEAGACTGDVGSTHFVDSAKVNTTLDDTARDLRWNSSVPMNPTALLQVSLQPFGPEAGTEPTGLLYSEMVTGSGGPTGSGGTFTVDFANLRAGVQALTAPAAYAQGASLSLEPLLAPSEADESLEPWLGELGWSEPSLLWPGVLAGGLPRSAADFAQIPSVYYARVIPIRNGQPSGPASNTVVVEVADLGVAATPQIYSDYPPQAYLLELSGFNAPTPPWLHWGCVTIVSVDESSWVWSAPVWSSMKGKFLEAKQEGWAYCPSAWKGQGGSTWYEDLWTFITDGSSWLSQAYEDIKAGVVEAVASGLNAIPPGDLCGDSCKAWLKAGLEAGLAALGVPPSLPDVSQLTDEGIAYLVEEGARQIGVDCGELCQEILTEQLHALKDEMLSQQVASYGNADVAHDHGYNPLPLPPEGLEVEPALGSSWQMGYATLRMTRTPESASYSVDDLRNYSYTLLVGVRGYNEWMVGKTISVATALCYNDASMWPCDYRADLVTAPLEGSLFGGSIPMPDLQPGQSIDAKVVLIPNHWWYGDHEKYASNTWEWDDDWWHLYNHGQGRMSATLVAQGVQFGAPAQFVVAQSGVWEFALPDVNLQGMGAP